MSTPSKIQLNQNQLPPNPYHLDLKANVKHQGQQSGWQGNQRPVSSIPGLSHSNSVSNYQTLPTRIWQQVPSSLSNSKVNAIVNRDILGKGQSLYNTNIPNMNEIKR